MDNRPPMWFVEVLGVGHPCVSAEVVRQLCSEALQSDFTEVQIVANCFLHTAYEEAVRIREDANSPITDIRLEIIPDND